MTQITTLKNAPINRFAFGTMQFGGNADEQACAEMFEVSRAAGINHFDTAYIYTDGKAETILGSLAASERDDLVIASKVAYDGNGDPAKMQIDFDVTRLRLGMDQIDILYLHQYVGDDLPRALEWLAALQSAGHIRYIGLSNFAAWQVMKAVSIARDLSTRIDIIQPMYNLVKRQAEVELLPMCADQDIVCATYSPLGGGLLTGKYAGGADQGRLITDARYNKRYSLDYMHNSAKALAELARDVGVDAATLAVAWVAKHESNPNPILSARSAAQLAPSLNAMRFEMDDALYARIAGLSPTPPPATDRWEERS